MTQPIASPIKYMAQPISTPIKYIQCIICKVKLPLHTVEHICQFRKQFVSNK